jgi:gamma-glutamyltranspeptidase/glutathione hydrolase
VDLIERFGRLSMGDILAPAIRIAEDGFPVEPVAASMWQKGLHKLVQASGGVELSLRGRAPRPGEIFRNPGLARTFKAVAEGGKTAFYQGEIAAAIAKVVRGAGGLLTAEDLAAHTSTWEEPISIRYRDAVIWECPPNGQGLVALLALNILQGFDLVSLPALSPERLHLVVEAVRLAFADARRYVADPLFEPAPLAWLLSPQYSEERRLLIDPVKTSLDIQPGAIPQGSDTVYFCTLDSDGNACSFINSNYMLFGTGIVPVGWGFSLQNRGANFSLQEGHANVVAPGKRPYHTIIPAMATRTLDGSFLAAFGVMGGFMQPQGHVQVALGLLDDALDPQAALDRPRFYLEEGLPDGSLALEEGIPQETIDSLAQRGHRVRLVSGHERSIFGRGQVIQHRAETGAYWAGSDPRGDGLALAQI